MAIITENIMKVIPRGRDNIGWTLRRLCMSSAIDSIPQLINPSNSAAAIHVQSWNGKNTRTGNTATNTAVNRTDRQAPTYGTSRSGPSQTARQNIPSRKYRPMFTSATLLNTTWPRRACWTKNQKAAPPITLGTRNAASFGVQGVTLVLIMAIASKIRIPVAAFLKPSVFRTALRTSSSYPPARPGFAWRGWARSGRG